MKVQSSIRKILIQQAIFNKSDEINQLKSTISELRIQLEKLKFEKREAVQKQIQSSNDEIKQLKSACAQLRNELENLNLKKKKRFKKPLSMLLKKLKI